MKGMVIIEGALDTLYFFYFPADGSTPEHALFFYFPANGSTNSDVSSLKHFASQGESSLKISAL